MRYFNPKTPELWIYNNHKARAIAKGKEFTLTLSKFEEIRGGNCVFSNLPPSSRTTYSRKDSPHNGRVILSNSIDRIDSRFGYHDWNVQSCNANLNMAKNDLFPEEWDDLIERMSEVFYKKNPGKLLALFQKLKLAQVA